MQISIFPEAKAHPKNKKEKGLNAKKCSSPYLPKTVNIRDENDLFDYVTSHAWSPSIFDGYRCSESFKKADFMAIDIDEGLGIGEAEKRCEEAKITALIAPSPNHSEDQHKFRVIIPLVQTITDQEVFSATWDRLRQLYFPELDPSCSDSSRFYYGCKPDPDSCVYIEGDLLEPDTSILEREALHYGVMLDTADFEDTEVYEFIYDRLPKKIPESVVYFFNNAPGGLPGEWINSLNSACFTLSLQGIAEGKIWTAIEKVAPYPLDKKDTYQIKRSIADGKKLRDDDL